MFYNPYDFGRKEVALQNDFYEQVSDAQSYFLNVIKPRLDRSYKLYIAYTGDRQAEIKKWQANVFVPYIQAVVETLMPRVLDARPEFSVLGRTEDDDAKAEKQQHLADFLWEIAHMDATSEDFVRSILIYGTGFLQVSWKYDKRKLKFLDSSSFRKNVLKWRKEERIFYDAPYCEWVDNYSLWYDWHNTKRESKHFWFRRRVLTAKEIKRRYPHADKMRLKMALASTGGDLTDYAGVRQTVKTTHQRIVKGARTNDPFQNISNTWGSDKYTSNQHRQLNMYEVFEWWRPFDDFYAVIVGGSRVPILKGGFIPNPFDFKEAPFIEATYLKIPGEFEGMGIPLILENPQIMLNLIKNQRLDAATLSIHKMWVVNPLANISQEQLVTRPFGIIYSVDPNGVREIQFSDIKSSAYREEDMLKSDMRYSSGVDDFSMGAGGGASSATEVRHLRESTLERVRLFINHLGDAYSDVLRYWMDMSRQFYTKQQVVRIVGDDGKKEFPLVEKDDLMGRFDYRAKVLPSIAGQSDVKKKQNMDLFQLLISLPFVDPQKLTAKVIADWGWSLDSVLKGEENDPSQQGEQGSQPVQPERGQAPSTTTDFEGRMIPKDVLQGALELLGGQSTPPAARGDSPFAQLSSPVNLLQQVGPPPTAPSAGDTPNLAGFNRGGAVNTNIPQKPIATEEKIMNRAFNIQK